MFEAAVGTDLARPVDLSVLFEHRPDLIALIGAHGFALFWPVCEEAYDTHVAVLPEGRGLWFSVFAREACRAMFEEYDAGLLIFRIPERNVACTAAARMVGGEFYATTDAVFPARDGLVPFNIYWLSRKRWLDRTGRRH